MSIASTPDGGWAVRWRDPTGVHHSLKFPKGEKQAALAHDQEMKRARRLGHLPQLHASKRTVGEAAAEWWTTHGSHTAPRTAALYGQLLHSHVLPALDAKPLASLTVADVERWLAELRTGPTAKSNALGILRQVFNYAMRAGFVQSNPCLLAKRPKAPAKEPINPPPPIGVEMIRYALFERGREGDAYMVSVLAYAGLRPHEMWRLTWEDIRENTILVRSSKTGKHRAVGMLAPLRADLAAWRLRTARAASERVFCTATGKPWTKDLWDNWRSRVWAEVAPEGIRPYDLRHFYVSMMLRDPSVSRAEAAEQAGHSLQVQDSTYSHVVSEGQGSFEDAIRAARAEVFGDERMAANG